MVSHQEQKLINKDKEDLHHLKVMLKYNNC